MSQSTAGNLLAQKLTGANAGVVPVQRFIGLLDKLFSKSATEITALLDGLTSLDKLMGKAELA